jgi:hypothetical protein
VLLLDDFAIDAIAELRMDRRATTLWLVERELDHDLFASGTALPAADGEAVTGHVNVDGRTDDVDLDVVVAVPSFEKVENVTDRQRHACVVRDRWPEALPPATSPARNRVFESLRSAQRSAAEPEERGARGARREIRNADRRRLVRGLLGGGHSLQWRQERAAGSAPSARCSFSTS